MRSHLKSHVPLFSLVAALLLLNSHTAMCCYDSMFTFGDWLTDTGNFVHDNPNSDFSKLPWGSTYFKRATGRISDGRIIIDFIAQAFNLPLLPPSKAGKGPKGTNFAYFGATALPQSYYRSKWGMSVPNPVSLDMEIGWFKNLYGSNSASTLSNALVILGEIGGNDYNYWFFGGHPRDQAYNLIPDVVGGISSAIQGMISLGAKTIVVPGNFPIGCVPSYLNSFKSQNKNDYDSLGCLNWYNVLAQSHNKALVNELNRLRPLHPGVKLIYADYYGAFLQIIQNPSKYGISNPFVACCGGDGPYHTGHACNAAGKVWGNPSTFAIWDGTHLTEAEYQVVAAGVLQGPYANPPLQKTC